MLVGRELADPASETTAAELLDYAVALGQRAASLSTVDPLPGRQRAVDDLRTLTPPPDMPVLGDQRSAATRGGGQQRPRRR